MRLVLECSRPSKERCSGHSEIAGDLRRGSPPSTRRTVPSCLDSTVIFRKAEAAARSVRWRIPVCTNAERTVWSLLLGRTSEWAPTRPQVVKRGRALTSYLHFASIGRMSLFITCPVESVERATAFYTALGWTLNAKMSDHNVSCFAIAPEQYVMLGSREMYASVGGAEELVGGPDTPSKVTVSFDLGSREAVDELTERAGAAGGRIGDTDDYPFMYQRQFDDPDGYHYSPFWMKPDADPTA
jgi:predicted lactoylglutathione lyase